MSETPATPAGRPKGNRMAVERRLSPRKDADWWITPGWTIAALTERENLPGPIWEPACGDGAMVKSLRRNTAHPVLGTDLHDRANGSYQAGRDFLIERELPEIEGAKARAIVTNPPFNLATHFVRKALSLNPDVIALFLRLSFLEGQDRAATIFRTNPPARVWVFARRVTLLHGSLKAEGHSEAPADMRGAMSFAWFVWQRHHTHGPTIGWIS